jgi:hypothetical protein
MKPHMHVRMISNEGCITRRKCTRFYGFRKSFGIFRDFLEFLGLLYRGRLFKARLALTLVVYRCMSVQGAIIRVLTQGLSEKFGGPGQIFVSGGRGEVKKIFRSFKKGSKPFSGQIPFPTWVKPFFSINKC